jgi:hypothetical protein
VELFLFEIDILGVSRGVRVIDHMLKWLCSLFITLLYLSLSLLSFHLYFSFRRFALVVSWELPESMITFYDVGLPWFLHTILNHISSIQTILVPLDTC